MIIIESGFAMKIHPHAGELLREDVLLPLGIWVTEAAKRLGMSAETPTVSPLPDAARINPPKPAPGAVKIKGSVIAVDLSEVDAIKEPATAGGT